MAASVITRDTWTNDTGTPSAPVGDGTLLQNSVLQNHIYARIDEMFAGAGAYATFRLGGKFAVEGFGTHSFSAGGSGLQILGVRNTTAGATNGTSVYLGNDVSESSGILQAYSSTYTTNGYAIADSLLLYAERIGGLNFATVHPSAPMRFYVGTSTYRGTMFSTGGFSWGDTTDPGATNFRVAGTGVFVAGHAGDFKGGADNLYDLGTSAVRWNDLFLGGIGFIGATSNANMTQGLTLNQAASDNEIFSLKSSDVAHGITGLTETDTYGLARKQAGGGGLDMWGVSSLTDAGLRLEGVGNDSSGRSTGAFAPILLNAWKKSGTTIVAPAADSNIMAFAAGTTTRFILDSDGDSHQDVGTAWTNFDADDDLTILKSLAVEVSRQDDPWKDLIRRNMASSLEVMLTRQQMQAMKLVTFNDDGHHFLNMSRLTMLHTGALRQLAERLAVIEDAPDREKLLAQDMMRLEARLAMVEARR